MAMQVTDPVAMTVASRLLSKWVFMFFYEGKYNFVQPSISG